MAPDSIKALSPIHYLTARNYNTIPYNASLAFSFKVVPAQLKPITRAELIRQALLEEATHTHIVREKERKSFKE